MNFTSEVMYDVEDKEWNQALTSKKSTTAFQIASFYKPHQSAFGSKPIFIIIKNSTGDIVGQLSAVIHFKDYWTDSNIISRSIVSKLNLGAVIIWHHGPVIHDISHRDEILSLILREIEKIAIKNNVIMIKGSTPPLDEQFFGDFFKKVGYNEQKWITYITDLNQKIDDLYNSLHNKTRYDIRKGEKSELEFEEVNDISSLYEYAELKFSGKKSKELIKRNKILIDNLWKILYKSGNEKMFLLRHNGELVGGIDNFIFNKNVVQNSVTNASNRKLYGGSFLMWKTIKWSMEMKQLTYDTGGANPSPTSSKEKGIDFFKSKWSGKIYDYAFYTKILSKTKMRVSSAIKQPSVIPKKISKLFR